MSYYPTQLSYRGTSLTTSNFRIAFRIVVGLAEMPTVRGRDTIIPGAPGRVRRNRVGDVLFIEADGFVMGTGSDEQAQREDMRDALDEIRALMDPTAGPGELVATMEDGSTRSITASPVDDAPVMWGDDAIPAYRTGSLKWESVDAADWGVAGS